MLIMGKIGQELIDEMNNALETLEDYFTDHFLDGIQENVERSIRVKYSQTVAKLSDQGVINPFNNFVLGHPMILTHIEFCLTFVIVLMQFKVPELSTGDVNIAGNCSTLSATSLNDTVF